MADEIVAQPRIDPQDRRYILFLNRQAVAYRKLLEITTSPQSALLYAWRMGCWQADLDRAVEDAMRRAA